MANDYKHELITSAALTRIMRDINALEGTTVVPYNGWAFSGSSACLLSDSANRVIVYDVATWSVQTAWNLPARSSENDWNASIAANSTHVFVLRFTKFIAASESTVYRYTLAGALENTYTTDGISYAVRADSSQFYVTHPRSYSVSDNGTVSAYNMIGEKQWDTDGTIHIEGLTSNQSDLFLYSYDALGYGQLHRVDQSSGDIEYSGPSLSRGLRGGFCADDSYIYGIRYSGGLFFNVEKIDVETLSVAYVGENDSESISILEQSGTNLYVLYKIPELRGISIRNKSDLEETSTEELGATVTDWTRWYGYGSHQRFPLGEPDGGITNPEDDDLVKPGIILSSQHIADMRSAVENLAQYYENAGTGNPWNFTDSDPDNLYYAAMGDRTKYGATGGAKYNWTQTIAELNGTVWTDLAIGEVFECVEKLKGSAAV